MDIVLLSGGADSVFALDWALKNTDEPITALHIFMPGPQGQAEQNAVRRIVPYMQRTRRPFELEISTIRWAMNWEFHHAAAPAVMAAGLVLARKDVRYIYRGDSQEERHGVYVAGDEGGGVNGSLIFEHLMKMMLTFPGVDKLAPDIKVPEERLPGGTLSKVEYVAKMEPELRAMLMSCVLPQKPGSRWIPCGTCRKCKLLEDVL